VDVGAADHSGFAALEGMNKLGMLVTLQYDRTINQKSPVFYINLVMNSAEEKNFNPSLAFPFFSQIFDISRRVFQEVRVKELDPKFRHS